MHKNAYSFSHERNHIRLHTNRVAVGRGGSFMYHNIFNNCVYVSQIFRLLQNRTEK